VQVTACVAPGNSPCRTINANLVPPSQQTLQSISGGGQAIPLNQAFQPVVVRVVDQSTPPNSVIGATVIFLSMVLRPEGGSGNSGMPVILSTSQATAISDSNGMASIIPSVGAFSGTLEVDITATAGANSSLQYVLQALPATVGASGVNKALSSF
jgi:hypothetical protein